MVPGSFMRWGKEYTDKSKKRFKCPQVDVDDGCYSVERNCGTGLVVGGTSSMKSVEVTRRDLVSDPVSWWPKGDI